VVGEAGDGSRAIELCASLRPDVVTLDMILPSMTGLAATEHIMAYFPTPILIVSASLNRGELFKTYEALAAGAIDVLDKPREDEPSEAWDARFVAAVKLVSRLRVITHPRARLGAMGRSATAEPMPALPREGAGARMVAIGGSTGSPGAVVDILRGLGPAFDLPILLVVHISEPFGRAFAEWLDGLSPLRVKYAQDGEAVPAPGDPRVLMAPPGRHLRVDGGRLRLTHEAERHSCRPSVDVLFESLAANGGAGAVACLLTGMGKDGARGLLDIRRAGGLTIAQDEASSVVFGMAREAVLLGAAARVLPLPEIAAALLAATGTKRRQR
jgi:two-component system chemotaxis response regulator CheB